jgi:hypothetical protein
VLAVALPLASFLLLVGFIATWGVAIARTHVDRYKERFSPPLAAVALILWVSLLSGLVAGIEAANGNVVLLPIGPALGMLAWLLTKRRQQRFLTRHSLRA